MQIPFLSTLVLSVSLTAAHAQVTDKFHITPQERAVCEVDATTLCSSVFPDEDALIACMKANERNLSPTCLKTFTAGLSRRHM